MTPEQAKAVLEIHVAEGEMMKRNPQFSAIIEKMRRAGYPRTAGIIFAMGAMAEEEDDDKVLSEMTSLLSKDWS